MPCEKCRNIAIRAPPVGVLKILDFQNSKQEDINLKKVFYIIDKNGEFLSEDGKKRYKALSGQALYEYLRSEEGKIKYFDVWQDDDRAVMVGVEVPTERAKAYESEKRRRRYLSAVMEELDISITSLEVVMDAESGSVNGESALSSLSIDIEDALVEKIEKEELHRALKKLTQEERAFIKALFFDGYSERDYAKKTGVYHNAVHKKKLRILKKLKNFLKN